MPRIVTVFGATGTQGSSVVEALLKDGAFTPRAITRDVASQGAKGLSSRGVQVVKADVSNEGSVKKALEGSEAVFIVGFHALAVVVIQLLTLPYHRRKVTVPFTAVSEITQASNIINASKAVGVKYVVWRLVLSLCTR